MIPQETVLGSPRPRNSSVASVITAKMTEPMKLMPTMEIRFGKISNSMMRQLGSPSISADFTKSRWRMESVSERVTRTPQAQEVRPRMMAITRGLAWPMKAARTSSSGRLGTTSTILVKKLMTSSITPPL
ncbi:hypothetical protein D9M68_932480 [compost metagenome]